MLEHTVTNDVFLRYCLVASRCLERYCVKVIDLVWLQNYHWTNSTKDCWVSKRNHWLFNMVVRQYEGVNLNRGDKWRQWSKWQLQQRETDSLNLNCSSNSSCFLSFCSCSRSKRERGSYSSSGASEGNTNNTHIHSSMYWGGLFDKNKQLHAVPPLALEVVCQLLGFVPSGSSGFLTFSHSSCLFFLRSSSSASVTNFLLRSVPPPAITTSTHTHTSTHTLILSITPLEYVDCIQHGNTFAANHKINTWGLDWLERAGIGLTLAVIFTHYKW